MLGIASANNESFLAVGDKRCRSGFVRSDDRHAASQGLDLSAADAFFLRRKNERCSGPQQGSDFRRGQHRMMSECALPFWPLFAEIAFVLADADQFGVRQL